MSYDGGYDCGYKYEDNDYCERPRRRRHHRRNRHCWDYNYS